MKNLLFIAVLGCSYTFLWASAPDAGKPAELSAVAQLQKLQANTALGKKVCIGAKLLMPKVDNDGVEVFELIFNYYPPLLGATDDREVKALRRAALQEALKKYQK